MNVLAPFPDLAEFALRVTSKQSGVGFVERCHKVVKRIIATGARKDQKFERSASQAFVNVNSKQMKKIADPLYEVRLSQASTRRMTRLSSARRCW